MDTYFLEYLYSIIKTNNSDKTEVIHAPYMPNKGMNNRFKQMLVIAPITVALVYSLSFL